MPLIVPVGASNTSIKKKLGYYLINFKFDGPL